MVRQYEHVISQIQSPPFFFSKLYLAWITRAVGKPAHGKRPFRQHQIISFRRSLNNWYLGDDDQSHPFTFSVRPGQPRISFKYLPTRLDVYSMVPLLWVFLEISVVLLFWDTPTCVPRMPVANFAGVLRFHATSPSRTVLTDHSGKPYLIIATHTAKQIQAPSLKFSNATLSCFVNRRHCLW